MVKYLILFLTIMTTAFGFNYHGCALAPDNLNGWVVCLDTALIFHTSNGGVTWEHQPVSDSALVFFDVTCTDELLAWTCGNLGQIYHTSNGGLEWVQQCSGLSKYATRIEFIDTANGWAACGNGIVGRTTTGGVSPGGGIPGWEQNMTPWYAAELYGISFVNQSDGWAVAGWPDTLHPGQGLILHSSDGGIMWDSLYQVSGYEDFLDVYFLNLLDGIVVGGDDQTHAPIILKTTNGGQNWNPITAPVNAYYLRAVDFVDNEGWIVGKHGTIIHTTDYGNTWTFQSNPAESTLFDVDFTDNLHGIACGYNIILTTTDGGQNWLGIQEDNAYKSPQAAELAVYPNPCRQMTEIRCQLPEARSQMQEMALKIYDCSGRAIKSFNLASNVLPFVSTVIWNGADDNGRRVPQGIYFVRLNASNCQTSKKVILLE